MKGKAYANRKKESDRPQGDFYETPSALVIELLESGLFPQTPWYPGKPKDLKIFDPCCGKYAIGNVLRRYGYENITEKDLMYGYDFLKDESDKQYDCIIMNPPFKLFDEFVKKAKKIAKYVFCIGKMNYFGAHSRNVEGLWNGLRLVLPFDRMIAYDQPEDEEGKVGVGMMVTAFFFWDRDFKELPVIKVLDVQKYIRSKK